MRRVLLLLACFLIGAVSAQESDVLDLSAPAREVVETEHFVISRHVRELPNFEEFVSRVEEIYAYVSQRMDFDLEDKLDVSIYEISAGPCPVRGLALMPTPEDEYEDFSADTSFKVVIFVDETASLEYLLGIFAHELGHILHMQGFATFPSPGGLAEGLASWAAGRYWTAWHQSPSFSDSVRNYLRAATFLPLSQNIELTGTFSSNGGGANCLTRRDMLYKSWAAFVEFLINSYGAEKFKELLSTVEVDVSTEVIKMTVDDKVVEVSNEVQEVRGPDWSIYGKSFETLEQAWLESTALRQIPGQPLVLPTFPRSS